MKQIAIGIPAYRNPETLSWVVESLLQQSHRNVKVFVFDNGFAEGFHEAKQALQGLGDNRLVYRANSKNLGPLKNYRRCFAEVANYPYGMVLPSDIALFPETLEILVGALRDTNAQIAFAPGKLFETHNEASKFLSASSDFFSGREKFETEKIASSRLITEFYGDGNLGGEYQRFSFVGSLGEGHLFSQLGLLHSCYQFHGWEFQNSMLLASKAKHIVLLRKQLRVAVTGLEKFGGARRPTTDWTRIEPILATFETANRLRKKNRNFPSHMGLEVLRNRHSKLLKHYVKLYGQHKVAAWATYAILSLRLSNAQVLRLIFCVLIRFRSRES